MSLKQNSYVYGQSVRGTVQEFKDWILSGNYIKDKIKNGDEEITFIHKSRIYPKTIYVVREDIGATKNVNLIHEKISVDQKQMVYFSQKCDDKQRQDRNMMVEKAKDLISNSSKYNKATSYGTANYVKNLKFLEI